MAGIDHYQRALDALFATFPEAELAEKDSSMLMHTINIGLMIITFGIMRNFMTGFVTTIGWTIYLPKGWDERTLSSKAVTIRHETVHIRQRIRYGTFLYRLRYLCWPLPTVYALGRLHLEQEAYEESLRAWMEYEGIGVLEDMGYRAHVIEHFLSANYFWTHPFKDKLDGWYDGMVEKLRLEATAN